MDYNLVLDVLGIILALGASFYLSKIAQVLKGGILARGMTIIAASPLLIALSAFFELLSEAGFGEAYDIFHDLLSSFQPSNCLRVNSVLPATGTIRL